MKRIVNNVTKKPLVKGSLYTVGAAVTVAAGYVVLAEGVLRWLDNQYSVLEDLDD